MGIGWLRLWSVDPSVEKFLREFEEEISGMQIGADREKEIIWLGFD
jgi:hypothetical protein